MRENVGAARKIPTLETERLILRPFGLADAPAVEAMAGDHEVAAPTLNIPHPYPAGGAARWIGTHAAAAASGEQFTFAVTRKPDGALLGAIGIGVEPRHRRAELGYWLGRPYWGRGYMTEAARRVVAFGFADLGLNRIQALCFPRNVASARVMQKAGLRYEGTLREYVRKGDAFEDLAMYALCRSMNDEVRSTSAP
jgi:RimJ/RimL family protein N-acetyltransferase